ncbi:uncharacterized protein PGRI_090830 [Penicillium griseofulvum]|uniref:Uncharacterized protein n=1 Tax=Penicillium patulum TaxID=5078 RepID=A0A135LRV2_PENPA|nr:uncharacterized protein PGRI_090830 [Penicillium griseofulvum]KXG51690.1 hypothetical protein PGRI_090830 [Penicillium griseofulvum]
MALPPLPAPKTIPPEAGTSSLLGGTPGQVRTLSKNRPTSHATVRSIECKSDIDKPGLRAKVCFMTSIETPEEEILVRSLHPSLKDCNSVSVVEGGPVEKPLWLVSAGSAQYIKNTHAAGREIHVLPKQYLPPVSPLGIPVRDVPIEAIDPRSFLQLQQVISIREAFPGSVGVQILPTGWLLVLFLEKKSLEACWDKGVPCEVGGLRIGYLLESARATATPVESGRAVSGAPGSIAQQAALGLRLRLPGGQEAITTVTHPFVRLADSRMSKIRKRFTEHILAAKEYLKRMKPPPRQAPQAGIVHPKQSANSPVGKQVWLSGTETCIGTITVTYDRCTRHRLIPYPYGFQHDLSLITGPNLPQLTNPPHTPRVTEWGPYEEALQGRPVLVYRYNIATGNSFIHQGYGIPTQAHQCIIHGAQYSWDARAFGTALLWRTLRDTESVRGASGSVLCLGEPQHETARALLFQNFEGPLPASEHVHIDKNEDVPTFKGGFLLPEEIRRSQIITARDVYPGDFRTPQRSSNSGVHMQECGMTVRRGYATRTIRLSANGHGRLERDAHVRGKTYGTCRVNKGKVAEVGTRPDRPGPNGASSPEVGSNPNLSGSTTSPSPGTKVTPKRIRRSRFLLRSPEEELAQARIQAFRLDYYDLSFRLHLAHGARSHYLDRAEIQALEERTRREETMEGYGAKRTEPTSIEVKEREAKGMAELMSTRQLLVHQDYTEGERIG